MAINNQDYKYMCVKNKENDDCCNQEYEKSQSDDNLRFNIFSENYAENQAFANKLREKFYNETFLNKKDMLIDKGNLLVLFEFKLIMRKFFWNKKQQIFRKIPMGVMKKALDYNQDDIEDSSTEWAECSDEFMLNDYPSKQAFRNKLQQIFYESVVLNCQDMLVDRNVIILFEHKLVMRKFSWNPRTQDFEKVPTGVSKEHKKLLINEEISDQNIKSKEEIASSDKQEAIE